jgi:hypothetical protein
LRPPVCAASARSADHYDPDFVDRLEAVPVGPFMWRKSCATRQGSPIARPRWDYRRRAASAVLHNDPKIYYKQHDAPEQTANTKRQWRIFLDQVLKTQKHVKLPRGRTK